MSARPATYRPRGRGSPHRARRTRLPVIERLEERFLLAHLVPDPASLGVSLTAAVTGEGLISIYPFPDHTTYYKSDQQKASRPDGFGDVTAHDQDDTVGLDSSAHVISTLSSSNQYDFEIESRTNAQFQAGMAGWVSAAADASSYSQLNMAFLVVPDAGEEASDRVTITFTVTVDYGFEGTYPSAYWVWLAGPGGIGVQHDSRRDQPEGTETFVGVERSAMAYGGVHVSLDVYMIAEANYNTPPGPGQASAHVSAVGSITVNTTPQPVASINVTPYHVTYDGNAHTATGTATGVGGADLERRPEISPAPRTPMPATTRATPGASLAAPTTTTPAAPSTTSSTRPTPRSTSRPTT